MRGIRWPVAFTLADGRDFIVLPPAPGPNGLVLRCRVDAGGCASEFEVGCYYGEQTAGAVIGRMMREWIQRTGEGIVLARSVSR